MRAKTSSEALKIDKQQITGVRCLEKLISPGNGGRGGASLFLPTAEGMCINSPGLSRGRRLKEKSGRAALLLREGGRDGGDQRPIIPRFLSDASKHF